MTTAAVEKKAAAEAVDWVRDQLEFSYVEIGVAVDADERTVRRWKDARAVPRGIHRTRIEQLRKLQHMLLAVHGTSQAAAEWMRTSVPALRGRTPGSLFREGKVSKLIELLATMESGAFI